MKTTVVVLRRTLLWVVILLLSLVLASVGTARYLGWSASEPRRRPSSQQASEWGAIESIFGRGGSVQDDVLKFTFPRGDLNVRVGPILVEPELALTSWGAFKHDKGETIMMGDLVLLDGEIDPVVAKFVENHVDVTALHNHLVGERPEIMYLHYEGRGDGARLAGILKDALQLTATPLQPRIPPATMVPAWTTIESIFGQAGQRTGSVLGFSFRRKNRIVEHGVSLPPSMGLATAINFQPVGGEVATSGDFVLVASEVNPVVRALIRSGISVAAVHNHMLYESPRLFFLHFWGVGDPARTAQGLREALSRTNSLLPGARP